MARIYIKTYGCQMNERDSEQVAQMLMEHLYSCLLVESHVLAQVDFSVATLSQQADQPVVAKLLSKSVRHLQSLHFTFEARMKLQVDQSFW